MFEISTIAALERLQLLEDGDRAALRNLRLRHKIFSSREDIAREGAGPDESCFVGSGFAARAQYLADGGRQPDQVHIAGDFIDFQSLHLRRMDHSIITIFEWRVAYMSHRDLSWDEAHAVKHSRK